MAGSISLGTAISIRTIELRKINESGTGAEDAATKMGIIKSLFGIDKPEHKEEKK